MTGMVAKKNKNMAANNLKAAQHGKFLIGKKTGRGQRTMPVMMLLLPLDSLFKL
jgi:hypothetical protein